MLVQPTNAVLVGDCKPLLENLKVETATQMFPGRLVEKGTNDDDIVVNPVNNPNPVGWLGYEQTHKNDRPATVDTIYVAGDWATVLSGGNFRILGRLASGQSVNKGDQLCGAASGELTAATAMTITVATGTVAVTSDKAQPDEAVAGAYGAQGPIVAIAEETVDASLAAADIIVRSLI